MKTHRFFPHHFLPHRLCYENGGGGPSEGWSPESAEGGGGVSEAAQEAIAEELRKAAAAQKRDQKDEKKARKQDDRLARLIEQFIHAGGEHDAIVLLISRLLKRNTPIAVVIAILSLNYPEFQEILADHIAEEDIPRKNEEFDAQVTALVPLGSELTEPLDAWADLIFTHASFYPMKTILALAEHQGVNSSCLQLSTYMIQNFLRSHPAPDGQLSPNFEQIRNLSDALWRSILKKVHKLCRDQGLLSAPKADEEEDDEE